MSATTDPDLAFFRSTPWCSKLLSDPELVIVATDSRQPKSTTEDAVFAVTLNTPSTISHCVTSYKRPAPDSTKVDEVRCLLGLGPGLNGQPGWCHGGIIATIMDEVIGVLLTVSKDVENAAVRPVTVTAYLKTTYLKPVTTPQAVLVTANFREIKGRKYFIDAALMNGEMDVLAKGESLFIRVEKSSQKL